MAARTSASVTYAVLIACPNTGREIDTGLSMTKAAFAHPAVESSAVYHCQECGNRHEFRMTDARLQLNG
jgi:predicted RNA-binding Zn-ribbon protein involved in translation (DUF1610 family)